MKHRSSPFFILVFCSCQEKYESNCVSRLSVTDIFCSLLNKGEFLLLGRKYSSVPVTNSMAYLFWQLYGTSCAPRHTARVQSRRRASGVLFLWDRLLLQLLWTCFKSKRSHRIISIGFFSFHFCNTKASSCLVSGWSCLLWVDLHSVSWFTSLLTFFMLALLLHDWNRFAPVRKHFK